VHPRGCGGQLLDAQKRAAPEGFSNPALIVSVHIGSVVGNLGHGMSRQRFRQFDVGAVGKKCVRIDVLLVRRDLWDNAFRMGD
jgi:hypothetical protein